MGKGKKKRKKDRWYCDVCGRETNSLSSRLDSMISYCPQCEEAEQKTEPWLRGYDRGKLAAQMMRDGAEIKIRVMAVIIAVLSMGVLLAIGSACVNSVPQ